jgi:hypothetical protein
MNGWVAATWDPASGQVKLKYTDFTQATSGSGDRSFRLMTLLMYCGARSWTLLNGGYLKLLFGPWSSCEARIRRSDVFLSRLLLLVIVDT